MNSRCGLIDACENGKHLCEHSVQSNNQKVKGLSEAYVKHLFNKNHQLAFGKLMSNMNEPFSNTGMYAFENSHYTFEYSTPVTGHSFENRIDFWISSFKYFHCLSALSRPKCVRCMCLACFTHWPIPWISKHRNEIRCALPLNNSNFNIVCETK